MGIRCLGPIPRWVSYSGTKFLGCKLLKELEVGFGGSSLPFTADGGAWREVVEKKLVQLVPEETSCVELVSGTEGRSSSMGAEP